MLALVVPQRGVRAAEVLWGACLTNRARGFGAGGSAGGCTCWTWTQNVDLDLDLDLGGKPCHDAGDGAAASRKEGWIEQYRF